MDKVVLNAVVRPVMKNASRSEVRKAARVPGIFYSKHSAPIPVDVEENAINKLVFTPHTHIVVLTIEGQEALECIIKDVQFDPVTDKVIHFDLQGLTTGETLQMEVPVQLIGSAIGVKDGGILQQLIHKLDVECLPSDVPQSIDLDITNLKMGGAIHVSDIKIENVSILNPETAVVVAVSHPKADKAASDSDEAGEPEVISKGKDKE